MSKKLKQKNKYRELEKERQNKVEAYKRKHDVIREVIDEFNQVRLYPSNMLYTKLRRDSPKFTKEFEKAEKDRIKLLDKFYSITLSHMHESSIKSKREKDELKINCSKLLYNASNSITASYELLRKGYLLQSPNLLRTNIETFCLVVAMHEDQEVFEKFKSDNYDINKSIKVGKKILPQIGVLQGLLSNKFVHLNSMHLEDESLTSIDGVEESAILVLDLIFNSIMLLYLVSELVFANYHDEILFWFLDDNGKATFNISSRGEELLREYQSTFKMEELYNKKV